MGLEPLNWMDTLLNDNDDSEVSTLVHLVGRLDAYEHTAEGVYTYTQDEMRVITKFAHWIEQYETNASNDSDD